MRYTKVLVIRVSDEVYIKLHRLSKQLEQSPSELVRELLEIAVVEGTAKELNLARLLSRLFGFVAKFSGQTAGAEAEPEHTGRPKGKKLAPERPKVRAQRKKIRAKKRI